MSTHSDEQAEKQADGGINPSRSAEQVLREEKKALRSMYRVTADRESAFEEKTRRLIELGCEYLDLPFGFLTRISEETQRIVESVGDHPLIQPGATCPLSEAYCRKTIKGDRLLAVQNASAEGWNGDPAYEAFGLGSYIGSKVLVEGELFGTFCFAAREARERPFAEREKTFLELMTQWMSYELERRQATEQLERQNRRLDNFAGLVSHDLRNPLNVLKGRLTLVQEELNSAPNEVEDHLDAATAAADRMDAIIEDVLLLTWSGRDLEAEDLERVSLSEIAHTSWDNVDTGKMTFRLQDEDIYLEASERRLQRLLENLFRNAVEHGAKEGTVRVGALPDGFYVEDDGPGIPVEKRESVLEAGYSSQETGTGLGLSIVTSIVDVHGWTLSVAESKEGGARFEITGTDPSEKTENRSV